MAGNACLSFLETAMEKTCVIALLAFCVYFTMQMQVLLSYSMTKI